LSGPNLSFADGPVARSVDFGVTNVHRGCRKVRLLRAQIGLKLHPLRFEDGFAAALGFGSEFTAVQNGPGLIEISIPAGKLARQVSFRGDGGFEALLSSRLTLIKTFLVFTFRASTNQLSLYSFLASFGCCNLRLCLIDTGRRR
jgi:hypothetical protein